MKLTAGKVAGFAKSPPADVQVFLLYGPDQGQVHELAHTLVTQIVPDSNDPFRVAVISKERLNEDPTALQDEAAALSLTGGQRVLHVREAGAWLATPLKDFLAAPVGDARIVIEAGELAPSAALRKLCEAEKAAAALPCYADEGRSLTALISSMLQEAGKRAEPTALAYLSEALGHDRLVVRGEVDKLLLYMGEIEYITFDDAVAAVGNNADISLDETIMAVAAGDRAAVLKAIEKLAHMDMHAIEILRRTLWHFERLHQVLAATAAGTPAASAVQQLRPAVFFKVKDMFQRAVSRWSLPKLHKALEKLQTAESQSKQTNMPADLIAERCLLELTFM